MYRLLSKFFFCLFLLTVITSQCYAQASVIPTPKPAPVTTTSTNDILIAPYGYPPFSYVSPGDIKTLLLLGNIVHFAKDQDEKKREIEAKWIIDALQETAVKLEKLPSQVEFPDHLKDKIRYNSSDKLLIFKMILSMSQKEKEQLQSLSQDELYKGAIETLFKKTSGIRRIKIKNAVIKGDLDFRVDDLLRPIDESGLEKETIKRLKERAVENVFLVSPRVIINDSLLEGKLLAGEDEGRKAIVVFQNIVGLDCTLEEGADFNGATFNKKAFFSGAIFKNSGANFGKVYFLNDNHFKGTAFQGAANFSGATFSYRVDFSETIFHSKAVFNGAHFDNYAFGGTFNKAVFKSEADFSEVVFEGWTPFSGITFEKSVLFSEAIFKLNGMGHADFSGTVFNAETDFSCTFESTVKFQEAIFKNEADFSNTKFESEIDFSRTIFEKPASFSGITFKERLVFSEVIFKGKANFNGTTFKGESPYASTFFDDVTFHGGAYFEKANFQVKTRFNNTTFHDEAAFRKAKFEDDADFSDTTFLGKVAFYEASFAKDVDLGGSNYSTLPTLPGTQEDHETSTEKDLDLPSQYKIQPSSFHTQEREQPSSKTSYKDIQIMDGSDNEIKVSSEDIRTYILQGKSVNFVKDQEEEKRTIGSSLITEALKKGVEKIIIRNAIITGDIDFHIKENLIDIDKSGIKAETLKQLKEKGVKKAYLVPPSIRITSCKLEGSLQADYDDKLKYIVIFNEYVEFRNSTVMKETNFKAATFNRVAKFEATTFNGGTNFGSAEFGGYANFDSSKFGEKVVFSNARFGSGASFGAAEFGKEVYFSDAEFGKYANANFFNANFSEKADFSNIKFGYEALFTGTKFFKKANFGSAEFGGLAKFKSTEFGKVTNFRYARFDKKTNFESAKFGGKGIFAGEAVFGDTTFHEWTDFSGTTFKCKADFSNASFLETGRRRYEKYGIRFQNSTFEREADFYNAKFETETDFYGTTFHGEAKFAETIFKYVTRFGTTFKAKANFFHATFESRADFDDTDFHSEADFELSKIKTDALFKATFHKTATFDKAIFEGLASFSTTFKGKVSFRKTTFTNGPIKVGTYKAHAQANFRNSTFEEDTDFDSSIFETFAHFDYANFKGMASFDKATFKGDSGFSNANFKSRTSFDAATFFETSFNTATFEGETFFRGTNFCGYVNFEDIIFQEKSDFSIATFKDRVSFRRGTFKKEARFSGAGFAKDVDIDLASYSILRISWRQLEGRLEHKIKTQLAKLQELKKKAKQSSMTVKKFLEEELQGEFSERLDKLPSEVELSKDLMEKIITKAHYRVSTRLEKLPPNVSFPSIFNTKEKHIYYDEGPNHLHFDGKMTENDKDMLLGLSDDSQYQRAIGELFQSPQNIYERPSDILQYDSKSKRLISKGLRGYTSKIMGLSDDVSFKESVARLYERSHGSWSRGLTTDDLVLWQEVYHKLIKNFDVIGDTKSADDAYYYYRNVQPKFRIERLRINSGSGMEFILEYGYWEKTKWWVEYIFFGLTCGYGVRPLRALAAGGVLILLFSLIYFSKKRSLEFKEQGTNIDFSGLPWYRRLYNCLYFSVTIFTPVGFGDIGPNGGFKAVAIVEGIIGWLTMALFLVTLGNVWLR